MKAGMRTSFTIPERLFFALGLAVAMLGLMNQAIWERPLLGLDPRQLAIVAFIPMALLLYYLLQRPDPRERGNE